MNTIKQLLTLVITLPLAALALFMLFAGATIVIGFMCLAMYTWVICVGVSAVYKSIAVQFKKGCV